MSSSHDTLPIVRLTLYKHGVAFVERRGTVDGEQVELVFRDDEVNDALKSLLVVDRQGGRVIGVSYPTPADAEERLAENPIKLRREQSLVDLISSLRGAAVRLVVGEGAQREDLQGQLVGVDLDETGRPPRPARIALLDGTTGSVRALLLDAVREIAPLDDRAQQDLGYFLETSRGDAAHRAVTLRLSPGAHDLEVSYLAPSPSWRVSYRLVAEAHQAPERAGATSGKLLLQGWGLFDNRLEHDLQDVSVTLVAGQPISFVYDLATSRIPERPVVEDLARTAGPVEFDTMMIAEAAPMSAPAPYAGGPPMGKAGRGARMAIAAAMAAPSIADLAQQPPLTQGTDQGELFAYVVDAPVSVKRGGSVLAPILQAQLPYERELLFNERKLPAHPVAALRFRNESGLVLERGPVTVLEDGAYRGEAIMPFTRAGAEVYLASAVELGVKVTVERATRQETAGIRIEGALLHIKQATITRARYRIESSLAEPRTVTVEHAIAYGSELDDTPAPAGRTAEWYRWRIDCAPRTATSFEVSERRFDWQAMELLDVGYRRLQEFLGRRWLDGATLDRIGRLLQEREAIRRGREEIDKLERERERIYAREEQLRQNMAALGAGGQEGALRQQVVRELQTSEQRLGAIETRRMELEAEIVRREGMIDAELETLNVAES